MSIHSDQLASNNEDLLGRTGIAKEIVGGLISYSKRSREGLSISLTGPWGSGKSTLLKFVQTQLNKTEEGNFKVISFNPWIFQKDEGIKEAFLLNLAQSMDGFEAKSKPISKTINKYIKAFRWIKYLSTVAGNIQEGIENVTDQFSDGDNVFVIKSQIDRLLKKGTNKIVVIIDDIDRLSIGQIIELMQTMTLVANFSNIIYLIAFDRDIVITALNSQFSGKGQEYLEKIIQVEYELPSIQEDKLEYLFNKSISNLTKGIRPKVDQERIINLWRFYGLKDYFTTIRDFKRYENALTFRLHSIAKEISVVDFLALEAIRIFDYASYRLFYKHFKTNVRKRELPDSGLKEEQWNDISSTASEVLHFLALKGSDFLHNRDINVKSLLDPTYFDRYFTLMKNENDVSEQELSELIARSKSRFNILRTAASNRRIENLIQRLNAPSIHLAYGTLDFELIQALINFFNQRGDLFEMHCSDISNMLINLICGNAKKRDSYLKNFFNSFSAPESMSSFIHIYFFHYMRLLRKRGHNFRRGYQQFDDYYNSNWEYMARRLISLNRDESVVEGFEQNDAISGQAFQYLQLLLSRLAPQTLSQSERTIREFLLAKKDPPTNRVSF